MTGLRALFGKSRAERQPDQASTTSLTKHPLPQRPQPRQPAPRPQPPEPTKPSGRESPGQRLASAPLVNPHLRADPRLRGWVIRTAVTGAVYLGFMIWHGWRWGVTAAAVYVAADVIYRSRTRSTVPPGVRVTSAQRYTRRRLKTLRSAGYLALNARTIPGTKHVIDHLVIGPAGIYAMDSQRMDKRLPLRMIGGMLYHGQRSLEQRLDHAQVEANLAARLIGAELGQKVRVRPVVVTYGPSSMWKISRVKGVALFDGSRTGLYFRQQSKQARGHHLDSGQIEAIFAAAARALPPLA